MAPEAIGPLITAAVWIAVLVWQRARTGIEWLAVVGCIVVLQLLLDLHTRYLGDLAIGALHVAFAVALLAYAIVRPKRRRGRSRAPVDRPRDGAA